MNLKTLLARPFANYIYNKTRKGMLTAIQDQDEILKMLLKTGKLTVFGKDHQLEGVWTMLPLFRRCLYGIMSS